MCTARQGDLRTALNDGNHHGPVERLQKSQWCSLIIKHFFSQNQRILDSLVTDMPVHEGCDGRYGQVIVGLQRAPFLKRLEQRGIYI